MRVQRRAQRRRDGARLSRAAWRRDAINAISPGVLEDSEKKVPLERIPAGRPGTYADLANALLFLVGDDASYLNGTNLKVSGGYLA